MQQQGKSEKDVNIVQTTGAELSPVTGRCFIAHWTAVHDVFLPRVYPF